jgi:hypothetical protein
LLPERWTEKVALSSARDDSGLFTYDFRDAKYLPFEHRGAVSRWSRARAGSGSVIRPQFDWDSVSDVVVHVRYTARFDAGLVAEAESELNAGLEAVREGGALQIALSFRQDAPDAWAAFLQQPIAGTPAPRLQMTFDRTRLPYLVDALNPSVSAVAVVLWCSDSVSGTPSALVNVGINTGGTVNQTPTGTTIGVPIAGQPGAGFTFAATPGDDKLLTVELDDLTNLNAGTTVDPEKLVDVIVLVTLDFP